jgi:thiosulfate reductase / polysulfide reductase chain A
MERIPTMCLNCSSVCGMIAKVKDGKILKLEGNPKDPNSKGKLCAKGQAAINMVQDPDRLLHPMKRVGPRGSGQWKQITWEEAIDTLATRLRALRQKKEPEKLLFQYGRDRTNGFLDRFTDAFGTPNKLGHRGLCSLNKRMAIKYAIGDTDWDTADFSNSHYILNFGSNFYEAHQGHVGMLQRVAEAKRKGAYMVTFDVRLSNTAAQSNEWIPIFPGTDGLVALAIGHVILRENLQDTEFIDDWTNASLEEWQEHYKGYTPEWAEEESGVSARVIERLAREFAGKAPHVTTVSNRGAHAHKNGFHNEWAIICLNALVGSIGKEGGYNYIPGDVNRLTKQPGPYPPKPTIKTELSHPSAFPFANHLYPRAVSSFIYPYLDEGRATIDTLISYYVNAPMSWPEGPTRVKRVLLDEVKVPFHVAIDAFYSETVEVADLVLPDVTFLEKWDLDSRNSYDFREYVGLRQPVVDPPGECRDIRDILIVLAQSIDDEMASYFHFKDAEEYVRLWAESVPGGLDYLKEEGIWVDNEKPQQKKAYLQEVNYKKDDPNVIIRDNGLIQYKVKESEVLTVGRLYKNKQVTGFQTPDRLFQFKWGNPVDLGDQFSYPTYIPINVEEKLGDEDFMLITFKWNVHTQSRTTNQIWLTEIVSDNPCWIHPIAAGQLNIKNGESFYIQNKDQEPKRLEVRAHLTEGIHPKVLAISASFGHWQYGRTAKGKGINPNVLIKDKVDLVGGGQAWNDTIVQWVPKD